MDVRQTQDRQAVPRSFGITLGDIYYTVFRRKWLIALCSAAGVVAAVVLYHRESPPYQSEAKLFIRYIQDNKSLSTGGADAKVKSLDEGSVSVISSEMEILTSLDLIQQVVEGIGPEKILAKAGGGNDRNQAAFLVKKNLAVEVLGKSSVIQITFRHPDAEIVQPVLRAMIDNYFKRHVEVHRAMGMFDDFLTQQTDQLRARLGQTEQDLHKARSAAGVISLDETKKAYTEEISKVRQEIFSAEAELAERQAALKELTKFLPATPKPMVVDPEAPLGPVDEYRRICARLELLWNKKQELLTQFTEETVLVKEVGKQIADTEKLKTQLERKHPKLANLGIVPPRAADQSVRSSVDPFTESARVKALESKVTVLMAQLARIRNEAAGIDELGMGIQELQRKKELEEANYRYLSANLEQSRIDEALGAGKVSNISRIESPTPPFQDWSKVRKTVALVSVGGILGGFALAFLIEFKFDRSVRRPIEVETRLHLPLFVSIPDVSRNGHRHLAGTGVQGPSRLGSAPGAAVVPANGQAVPAVESRHPSLGPFFEALRDRLVVYFEVRNLTHKPKLVAVTSPGKGAGVSTTAVGLAASLSETGDGKVLLVDMNQEQGAAHLFYKGHAARGLNEALQAQDSDQVQENLYVVAENANGDKLRRSFPKRFSQLVPKLKVSDYDYIVFDMPPISQTSVTPRLAGYMDMVLLVIESEKTDREIVRQANRMLADSKATVCAVLNKTRTYVPARLHQESLSDT